MANVPPLSTSKGVHEYLDRSNGLKAGCEVNISYSEYHNPEALRCLSTSFQESIE